MRLLQRAAECCVALRRRCSTWSTTTATTTTTTTTWRRGAAVVVASCQTTCLPVARSLLLPTCPDPTPHGQPTNPTVYMTRRTLSRAPAVLSAALEYTHTHPFNGPLSGTTRVNRYQKGKTNLDFSGARDSEWHSGISWAIYKSAPRSRQITTPAPHHSVFYRPDALPAAQPTVSKH